MVLLSAIVRRVTNEKALSDGRMASQKTYQRLGRLSALSDWSGRRSETSSNHIVLRSAGHLNSLAFQSTSLIVLAACI